MMISYAQDTEDVVLRRAFPADHLGFYIDVGANDPVRFSLTKHFYDHGWRGVNVEPVRSVWSKLNESRRRDVNLNVGLSDREGRLVLHEIPSETTWSTFSEEVAEHHRRRGVEVRTREVPVTTLARVCDEHVAGPIDFLKIDVEGLESEVISGGDWTRWRPRVVLVENAGHDRWEPTLLANGYRHAVTTPSNRVYVRDEDRSLVPILAEPIGPGDQFVPIDLMRELVNARSRGDFVGMNSLRVAGRLHRLAARHPRLATVGRAILRTRHAG